ncbi:hypothetical protein GOB94_14430 [Granulicella sp. 5B5]|uniref:hypothetical protein n=1 Tax=Granulicella sp. 5B5 TaxID=1617967 RepID=UPI0015F4DCC3|nr:hypothetical protein [Granulicella sp. 5B5]QMV19758.1 hypothetical protein GOB94_14430 [Granulicella sp. 5B5]
MRFGNASPTLFLLLTLGIVSLAAYPLQAQTSRPGRLPPDIFDGETQVHRHSVIPPTGPTPRTSDGHPDLSGYWKDDGKANPHGNIGKDLPGYELPFTVAGEAAHKYNLEHTIDPESLCLPGGLPREDAGDGGFQLLQVPGSTVFLYQYGTFRLVVTDGRPHSDDPDPTYFGENIGSWDGDTFVVDAIAFKETKTWADENADPHSDALHTIERWTRPDFGHLHLDLTIEDPKFYTAPIHFQRTWVAATKQRVHEEACNENNIDVNGGHLGFGPGPIRADGTRGYDHRAPLPPPPTKEHPAVTSTPN